MDDIDVIVVSAVRPEPTTGGYFTLYRHLHNQPGIRTTAFGGEPDRLTPTSIVRRSFGWLQHTGFHRLSQDFWAIWSGRWLDGFLPQLIDNSRKTVVVTVVHGDACMAALRFARRHNLPLVTFFHDWWPDFPDVHAPLRARLERDFRRLYRESGVALCVCEGMRAALAKHRCSTVLYPIPQESAFAPYVGSTCRLPFRLLYFGNLFDYGAMVAEALDELGRDPDIRLEVRGANPRGQTPFWREMHAKGLWQDFAPRDQLNDWLATRPRISRTHGLRSEDAATHGNEFSIEADRVFSNRETVGNLGARILLGCKVGEERQPSLLCDRSLRKSPRPGNQRSARLASPRGTLWCAAIDAASHEFAKVQFTRNSYRRSEVRSMRRTGGGARG